eukprot:TRINITY_DN9274_c0_g1_i1.p1 TRINITY_DN9274_c0_g1~~TRINITY_DN9274_c0_g1_i1.p1  ORF type:complete len:193 (-),score=83.76 TRINITY_DN9274_c0_g1_i1:117-695(-)
MAADQGADEAPQERQKGVGRGGGRGGGHQKGSGPRAGGKGRGGAAAGADGADGSAPKGVQPKKAAAPPAAVVHQKELSENINSMKFMQTAREQESRKKAEADQLRHRADMQWVAPGYEDEVAAAEAAQEKAALEAAEAAPPLRLHRRSYKGFNPFVEQSMKELKKKHAAAQQAAEEVGQAATLQAMKKRRVQ